MANMGIRTSFDDKGCVLRNKSTGKAMAFGSVINNLYALNVANISTDQSEKALVATLDIWHQRFAHVNASSIQSMSHHGVVKGLILKPSNIEKSCNGCILGKSHRTPIPRQSHSHTSNVLDLVHSDVLGPVEVESIGGSKYFISFIDNHSNWFFAHTMRHKSEALHKFIS